jgi:hypothetical protein
VAQFEKDSYQGMPSGMPVSGRFETGFSRRSGETKPSGLKPLVAKPSTASLKRCPGTNLYSSRTAPEIGWGMIETLAI